MKELQTIKIDKKIINRKIILQHDFRVLELKKYYDLHGEQIPQGVDTFNYDTLKNIVIEEQTVVYNFKYSEPYQATEWIVKVDGQTSFRDLEITYFHAKGNSLIVEGCVGAG